MDTNHYKQFGYLLIGQITALFGSSLSGFALGIWAYQDAGSATIYSAIALANILPIFALSPIAGAVVDRSNRKRIVLIANTATIGIVYVMYFLFSEKLLKTWHIIGLVTLNGVFSAFVFPAVTASIPLMVPKDRLTKANGYIALALGLVEFATPALAGGLLVSVGLSAILWTNMAALVFAICILTVCTVPQPELASLEEKKRFRQESLWQSILKAWRYLLQVPDILCLILFYALVVALTVAMAVLVQPMLLALTDPKTMGMTLSLASLGVIAGSLLMIVLKQPSNHMPLILFVTVIAGTGCIFMPIFTEAWVITVGGFIVMCCYPVFDSNCRALFQRKVEPTMLGRVIGIRNFVLGFTQTVMFIVVGPLADHIFEPAMQQVGGLEPLFGSIFGVGQGRGIAVMIALLGSVIVFLAMIGLLSRRLRSIDALDDISADTATDNSASKAIQPDQVGFTKGV